MIKSYEFSKLHGIIKSVGSFSKVTVYNTNVLRSLGLLNHREGGIQSVDHASVQSQEEIVQGKITTLNPNPNPNNQLDEK